jgi:tetratricopeptide (TPR) repeat protein
MPSPATRSWISGSLRVCEALIPDGGEGVLRRSWLCGGVAALVLALSSATQAQPAKSVASSANETDPSDPLEIGKAAFDAGRLEEALSAFETAYKQNKKPRTLFRVGDTADKLGKHARAISAFQKYLRLTPGSKDRPFIESRIRANEAAAAQPSSSSPSSNTGAGAPQPPAAAGAAPKAVASSTAPSQVALAAEAEPSAAPAAATHADSGEGGAGPVWIWAGAGVLVVAAIVVAGVLIGSSSASSTPAPVRGNVGGNIQTLVGPP